ncbi:hypothetical protein [Cupriavidus sp. SW-Y-13]|uniref:hypothetical protein n=1 Tax=Cupriavidus sp. SW-Y-13 TaxID=2653854 RepID=UPI001365452E|nr:hypothetical protein [Cupriavidus sp. SW-Y-13]MWL88126.1 hypothetical protein [Cupriavidus sp. SW-Y-13]
MTSANFSLCELVSPKHLDEGQPFWRYSWLAPRCAAYNRLGQPCGNLARKNTGYCYLHSGDKRPRWMRKPRGPDNPQRAHRRALEHLWRQDPWVPGFTCVLDNEAREVFLRWLEGHRVRLDWLAPALANWLMWQFVGLVRRRQLDAGEADDVIAKLRERDAAIADPPAGGSGIDMTAESDAFAWHPRLSLNGTWSRPRAGARSHPATLKNELAVEPERQGGRLAPPWMPGVGPARLTSAELMELAHAAERDRLLGGDREMLKARRGIERARRLRLAV